MQIDPYPDDVPLMGPGAPKADRVEDLIRLLVTLRNRFGNTIVRYAVSWGSRGLQVNDAQKTHIDRLKAWVNDLQSGMYVNCVYCGHRYGPKDDVPVAMAEILKEHVAQCPHHPMSHLRERMQHIATAASCKCEKPECTLCRIRSAAEQALQQAS